MSKNAFIPFLIAFGIVAGTSFVGRAEPTNAVAAATNQFGANRTNLHEQFRNLTPEQQRAKILELRRAHGYTNNVPENLTAAQRRAKIQARIDELHKKQAEGTLTPIESKQLKLLEAHTNRPPAGKIMAATNAPAASTNFQLLSK
jgi:hypothetical protein